MRNIIGILVLALLPREAAAQFYKGKTITMIVNYPAGGPTDLEGRIVAQHLPSHIPGNPTIVVKNVGGAGGIKGNRHIEAKPGEPTANLLLALAHLADVEIPSFGASTGRFDL